MRNGVSLTPPGGEAAGLLSLPWTEEHSPGQPAPKEAQEKDDESVSRGVGVETI